MNWADDLWWADLNRRIANHHFICIYPHFVGNELATWSTNHDFLLGKIPGYRVPPVPWGLRDSPANCCAIWSHNGWCRQTSCLEVSYTMQRSQNHPKLRPFELRSSPTAYTVLGAIQWCKVLTEQCSKPAQWRATRKIMGWMVLECQHVYICLPS